MSYNELSPLGSHPLTDPLWSNEAVELVHDGCEARRTDKIARIAASEAALANLRVCFEDMNVNCGHCTKCLRTMVPLALLDAKAAPFPPLPPARAILKAGLETEIERDFFRENVELAATRDDPRHSELLHALRNGLRRAELRSAIKHMDKALLGGRLRRLVVKRAPTGSVSSAPDD